MSLVEFIASIAWPTVILVVALVYRRLLTDLITGGVTRLRAGPFELAWDQAKSGVERPKHSGRSVASTGAVANELEPYVGLLGAEISELAASNPREAVLQAYDSVREALLDGLKQVGVDVEEEQAVDALGIVRVAESRGIVPAEVTDAVLGLNVLHNLAKHAPSSEMSPGRAYEYLAMADGALYSFAIAMKRNAPSTLVAAA